MIENHWLFSEKNDLANETDQISIMTSLNKSHSQESVHPIENNKCHN